MTELVPAGPLYMTGLGVTLAFLFLKSRRFRAIPELASQRKNQEAPAKPSWRSAGPPAGAGGDVLLLF